jgi:hypothetical protein
MADLSIPGQLNRIAAAKARAGSARSCQRGLSASSLSILLNGLVLHFVQKGGKQPRCIVGRPQFSAQDHLPVDHCLSRNLGQRLARRSTA